MDISSEDKNKIAENNLNYLREVTEKRSKILEGASPAMYNGDFIDTDAESYSAEENIRLNNPEISDEELDFFRRKYDESKVALQKGHYQAAAEALGTLPNEVYKEFLNEDTFFDLTKDRKNAEWQEQESQFSTSEGIDQISEKEKGELFNVSKNELGSIWSGFGTDEGLFNVIKSVSNYLYDSTTIEEDDSAVKRGFKGALRTLLNTGVNLVGGAAETVLNETLQMSRNPAQTIIQTGNIIAGALPRAIKMTFGDDIPAVNELTKTYEQIYDYTFGIAEDIDKAISVSPENAERIDLARAAKEDIRTLNLSPEDKAIITKYEWEVANGVKVHSKEVSDWLTDPKNTERLRILEDFKEKTTRLKEINEQLNPTHLKHLPLELLSENILKEHVEDEWKQGNYGWASYYFVRLQLDYYKSLFTIDPLNNIPDVMGQASYSIGLMLPSLIPGFGEAAFAQRLARLGMRFGADNAFIAYAAKKMDKLGSLLKNHENAYYIAKNIAAQTQGNYWENLAEGDPNGLVWTNNSLGALAGGWAATIDIAGDTLALYGAKAFGGALGRAFSATGASVFRQAIRDSLASGRTYRDTLLDALRRSSIGSALSESQLVRVVNSLATHGLVDATGEAIAGALEQTLNDLAAHGVVTDQVMINAIMSATSATAMKGSFGIHYLTMPGARNNLNGPNRLGTDYLNAYRDLVGTTSFDEFTNNFTNPSTRGTDAQVQETQRLQDIVDNAYRTNETNESRVRAITTAIGDDLATRGIAAPENLTETVARYVRARNSARNNENRLNSLNALLHRQVFGHHYTQNGTSVSARQAPLADADRQRLTAEWNNVAYASDFLNREGASIAGTELDIVNSYANQRLELGQLAESLQEQINNATDIAQRDALQEQLDDVLEETADLDARYGNSAHNNAVRHFMERNAGHLNDVELTGNTNYSSRHSNTPATIESRRDTRDFENAHDLQDTNRFSSDYLNALAEDLRSADDTVRNRARRIRSRMRQEINNKFNAGIQERQDLLDNPEALNNQGNFISNNIRRFLGYRSPLTGDLNARGRDILRQEISEYQNRLNAFNTLLDTLDSIDFEGTPPDPNSPNPNNPNDPIDLSGVDPDDTGLGDPTSPNDTGIGSPTNPPANPNDTNILDTEVSSGGGDDNSGSNVDNTTENTSGNTPENSTPIPPNDNIAGESSLENSQNGTSDNDASNADIVEDAENTPSADEMHNENELNRGEEEENNEEIDASLEGLNTEVINLLAAKGINFNTSSYTTEYLDLLNLLNSSEVLKDPNLTNKIKELFTKLDEYLKPRTPYFTDTLTNPYNEGEDLSQLNSAALARVEGITSTSYAEEFLLEHEMQGLVIDYLTKYALLTGKPIKYEGSYKDLCKEYPLLYTYLAKNFNNKEALDYVINTAGYTFENLRSNRVWLIQSILDSLIETTRNVDTANNVNNFIINTLGLDNIQPKYRDLKNIDTEILKIILLKAITLKKDSILSIYKDLPIFRRATPMNTLVALGDYIDGTTGNEDLFNLYLENYAYSNSPITSSDIFIEEESVDPSTISTEEEATREEKEESQELYGSLDTNTNDEATIIEEEYDDTPLLGNSPAALEAVQGNNNAVQRRPSAPPVAPTFNFALPKNIRVAIADFIKSLGNANTKPDELRKQYQNILNTLISATNSAYNAFLEGKLQVGTIKEYLNLITLLTAKDKTAALDFEKSIHTNLDEMWKAVNDTISLYLSETANNDTYIKNATTQCKRLKTMLSILTNKNMLTAFPGKNILKIPVDELVAKAPDLFIKNNDSVYLKIGNAYYEWTKTRDTLTTNAIPDPNGNRALVPCSIYDSAKAAPTVTNPKTNKNARTSVKTNTNTKAKTHKELGAELNKNNPVKLTTEDINNIIKEINDPELSQQIEQAESILKDNLDSIDAFEERTFKVSDTSNANITQFTINSLATFSGRENDLYQILSDGEMQGAIAFKHSRIVNTEGISFIITDNAPDSDNENAGFNLFEFSALKNYLNGKSGYRKVNNVDEFNSFPRNLIEFYGSLITKGFIPVIPKTGSISNFQIEGTSGRTQAKRVLWVKVDPDTSIKFWKANSNVFALAKGLSTAFKALHPDSANESVIKLFQGTSPIPKETTQNTTTTPSNPTTTPATPPEDLTSLMQSVDDMSIDVNTTNAEVPSTPSVASSETVENSIKTEEAAQPVEDTPEHSGGDGASSDTSAGSVTGTAPMLRGKPHDSTAISENNTIYLAIHGLGTNEEEREKLQQTFEKAIYEEGKSLDEVITQYVEDTYADSLPATKKRLIHTYTKIFAPLNSNFKVKDGKYVFSEEAKKANDTTIKNNIMYLNEFFTLTSELRNSTYFSDKSSLYAALSDIVKQSGQTSKDVIGVDPNLKDILRNVTKAINANLNDNFEATMDALSFNLMEYFTQNYLFMTPRNGVIAWNSPIVGSLCKSTDDTARQEELEHIKNYNDISVIRRLANSFSTFNSFSHRIGDIAFDCLKIKGYSELHNTLKGLTDTQLDAVKEMLGMVCTKAFVDSGFIIHEVLEINTLSDPEAKKNILRGRGSDEISYTQREGDSYFTAEQKSLDPFRDLHNSVRTLNIADITGNAYKDNTVKLNPEDVSTTTEAPIHNPKNREMIEKNAKLPFVIDKYYTDFIEGFLTEKVGELSLQEYIIKGINGEIAFDFNSKTSPFFRTNTTISKFAKVIGLETTNGKDAVTANAININNQNKLKTMLNILSLKYRFQLEPKDAKYDNGHTYYWTTYSIGTNSRFMYKGTDINPQADKEFTRQITYRDGDAVEVGFDQNFIVGDYQISEHDIFAFGVMQNLGLKPEKKGNLQTWYKDKNMMKAVRILIKYAKLSKDAKSYNKKLNAWLNCIEELENEEYEFEHKFAIINIMQTMEQFADANIAEDCTVDEFWKALDSSLKDGKYINYMHVESDGVTNGPAMGVLFTLGLLKSIKSKNLAVPEEDGYDFLDSIGVAALKGGIENVTMYDTKKAQDAEGNYIFNNKDLYETIKAHIDLDILCDVPDGVTSFTLDSKIKGTECSIGRFLEVCFDANLDDLQQRWDALNNKLAEFKKKLKSESPDTAKAASDVISKAYSEFIGECISRNWIKGPATQGAYGAMLKAITRGLIDHPIGGIFTTFFAKINSSEFLADKNCAKNTKAALDDLLSVLANPNIIEISKYNQEVAKANSFIRGPSEDIEGNKNSFSLSSTFDEINENIENHNTYFSQENTTVPKWEFWGNLRNHVRNFALPYNFTALMNSADIVARATDLSPEHRDTILNVLTSKLYASFLMDAQFNALPKEGKEHPYWFRWVESQYKDFLENTEEFNDFTSYLKNQLDILTDVSSLYLEGYNSFIEALKNKQIENSEEILNTLSKYTIENIENYKKVRSKLDDNVRNTLENYIKDRNKYKVRKDLFASFKDLDEQSSETFYPYILNAINYVALGEYNTGSSYLINIGKPAKGPYSLEKDQVFENSLDYIFGKGFTRDLFQIIPPEEAYNDLRSEEAKYATSAILKNRLFHTEKDLNDLPFITPDASNTKWSNIFNGKNIRFIESNLAIKQLEIANMIMNYFSYSSAKKDNGLVTLVNTAKAYNKINPYFYERNFKQGLLSRRNNKIRGIVNNTPIVISTQPYNTPEAREEEAKKLYIFDSSIEVMSRFSEGKYAIPGRTGPTRGSCNYTTQSGATQYVQCSSAYYLADTAYTPGVDDANNPVVKNVDLVVVPNKIGDNGLLAREAAIAGIPVLNYSAHVFKYKGKYYVSSTKEGRNVYLKALADKGNLEVYPLKLLKNIFEHDPEVGHRLKLMYIKNLDTFAKTYARYLGNSFELEIGKNGFPRPKVDKTTKKIIFRPEALNKIVVDNVPIEQIFTKSSKYNERIAENYDKGYDHSRGFTSENIYDLVHAIIPLFENTIGQAIFKSMMKPMGNNRAMTQMCIAPLEIISFMADSFKDILNGKPLSYKKYKRDENGNPVRDEKGNPVIETVNISLTNLDFTKIYNSDVNMFTDPNATLDDSSSHILAVRKYLTDSFNLLFKKGQLNLPSGEGISILKKEYESDLANPLRMTDAEGNTITGSGRISSTDSAGISLTVDGIQSNDSNCATYTALEALEKCNTMPLNIHDAVEMLNNYFAFMFNRMQNKAFLNSTANPSANSKYLKYASFFKNYQNLFKRFTDILNIKLSEVLGPNSSPLAVFNVAASLGLATKETMESLGIERVRNPDTNQLEFASKRNASTEDTAAWAKNAAALQESLIYTKLALTQAFRDGFTSALLETAGEACFCRESQKKPFSYHMGLFNKSVKNALVTVIGYLMREYPLTALQTLPDYAETDTGKSIYAETKNKFLELFKKAYNPYASIDEDKYNGILADPELSTLYENGEMYLEGYAADFKYTAKSRKDGEDSYRGTALFNMDVQGSLFNTLFKDKEVQNELFSHMLTMISDAEDSHLEALQDFYSDQYSIFQYNMGIAFKGDDLMDNKGGVRYNTRSNKNISELYKEAERTKYNEVKSTIATLLETTDPMLSNKPFPMDRTYSVYHSKGAEHAETFDMLSQTDKDRVLSDIAKSLYYFVSHLNENPLIVELNKIHLQKDTDPYEFIRYLQDTIIYRRTSEAVNTQNGALGVKPKEASRPDYGIPLLNLIAIVENYDLSEYCKTPDQEDALNAFINWKNDIKDYYRSYFNEWKEKLPQPLRTAQNPDERHNTSAAQTDTNLRDALNAAIHNRPINDPTVQQIVINTRNQVMGNYDALEDTVNVTTANGVGNIRAMSPQFSNTLRKRMEKVADMLAGVKVLIVNNGRAGLAATGKRVVAITRSVGDVIQHGIPMSVREMYAHENMHIVFKSVDRYSPEYKTLRKSWVQARDYFANNMQLLRQHTWTAAELGSQTLADQANAKEDANAQVMYDYMFGTGAEGTASNDVIEEFAVLAYTNEFINNALKQVPYVNDDVISNANIENSERSLLGALIDYISSAIDILLKKVTSKFTRNNINVTTNLMDTVEAVFDAAEQTQEKYQQTMTRQVLSRLSTVLDNTDAQMGQQLDNWGKAPIAQRINTLGSRLTSVVKNINRFSEEMVDELTGSYYTGDGRKVISAFINKISALNRTRQQNTIEDTRVLTNAFSNKLTPEMSKAIRNSICILDLQCLKNVGFTNKQIMDMLTTGNGLDAAIQQYTNTINNSPILNASTLPDNYTNYVINAANNLACKLATDSWSNPITHHNAAQIILGFGTSYAGAILRSASETDQTEIEKQVTAYISLQAMKLYREHDANSEDLQTIQELYQVETNAAAMRPESPSTGFDSVLNYHQGAVTTARNYLGNTTISDVSAEYNALPLVRASNVRKGYLKTQFNPYYESTLVTDKETYDDLQHKGFAVYTGPETSSFKPNTTGFTPVLMYNTSPLVNRHTSGALATIDTHFVGAEYINQEADLATYTDTLDIEETFNNILPIKPNKKISSELGFDSTGKIKAVRFVDSMQLREQLLHENTDFASALASTAASIQEKQISFAANRHLIDALIDIHNNRENGNYNPDEWIELSPDSDNATVKEDYSTLPQDTRRYIYNSLRGEHLYIKKEYYNLIFGFHNASLRRVMEPTTKEYASYNNRLLEVLHRALYKIFARKWGMHLQASWEYLVRAAKDTVVNKSLVVSLNNIRSNIQVLILAGVPLRTALADTIKGYEYFTDYNDKMRKLRNTAVRLNIEELTDTERAQLRSEYVTLQNDINNNPMREFIQLGGATSIVGGEYDTTREEPSPLPGILSFLDNNRSDIGALRRIQPILDLVFVRHNTKIYDMCQELATGTDTVAKWIYYTHLRGKRYPYTDNRRTNEVNATNAFLDVQEMFINYDLPTNKYMQSVNDLGVIWFSKFILRTQVPILNLFRHNFVRAALYTLFWKMFNPPLIDGAIINSNMLNIDKNLYNVKNPITSVIESSGELPAFKAISWFSSLLGN